MPKKTEKTFMDALWLDEDDSLWLANIATHIGKGFLTSKEIQVAMETLDICRNSFNDIGPTVCQYNHHVAQIVWYITQNQLINQERADG